MHASPAAPRRADVPGVADASHGEVTPATLDTFRELLVKQRHALLQQSSQRVEALDDLATVTDADEQLERELLEDLDARGREALQEIDDALARIDDGSYGRCARCGGTILAARLEVIPHARNCVPCERSRASGR